MNRAAIERLRDEATTARREVASARAQLVIACGVDPAGAGAGVDKSLGLALDALEEIELRAETALAELPKPRRRRVLPPDVPATELERAAARAELQRVRAKRGKL